MTDPTSYLYNNSSAGELDRLRGLEAIEDSATIALLTDLGVSAGAHCIEIGAGAGSIAYWLASRVGGKGHVVATDIDTDLLDTSTCEVWRHDIQRDELPSETFDLVHFRHLLIHLPESGHSRVIEAIFRATKSGGHLLAEESDLYSWRVDKVTPESIRSTFSAGVDAVRATYNSRGIDSGLGARLGKLVEASGFDLIRSTERFRSVEGGSSEATYQELSARRLSETVRQENPILSERLYSFAECFRDRRLRYQTRTTVAVSAIKPDDT